MNEAAHDMGHEDEDDNEPTEERDEGEAMPEAPPPPVATTAPRARPRAVAEPIDAPLSPFGALPHGVTHWGLRRKTMGGDWEPLSWAEPGGKVAAREWPVSELSTDTIQERWGAGVFEVQWIKLAPRGGRNVLRGGRQVEILREVAAPAAAAAPGRPASVFDQMGDAMKLMAMIEERGDQSFLKIAKFAEIFGNRAPTGPSFEEIRSLLRDEREHAAKATAEAVRAAVEPLQKQIAELAEEEDDGDDDGGLVGAAAQGAKPLFRGRKWWQVLGNYATENPQVIEKVAPVALGAINNVTSALAAAMAPPRRPVAVVVEEPAPALHGGQPNGPDMRPSDRVNVTPPPGVVDTRPPPPA